MLYKELLKTRRACPFCNSEGRELIGRKTAYLTYALAPYSKNHLLVVPRRHVTSFRSLTKKESVDIDDLLEQGANIMRKLKVKDYTILVREGVDIKSIAHLHYHIIPNHAIGDLDSNEAARQVLTAVEIGRLMTRIKKIA